MASRRSRNHRDRNDEPRRRGLVASAAVMSQRPEGLRRIPVEQWQNEAWLYFDEVGELRFGVGWLANGMSRVNIVAARQPQHQGDEPTALMPPPDPADIETDDAGNPLVEIVKLSDVEEAALDFVAAIAGGADAQGQLLAAASVQLSVPGIGYILAEEPDPTVNPDVVTARQAPVDGGPTIPVPQPGWNWRVLSQDELRAEGDVWEVQEAPSKWRRLSEDHVLVRFWRAHPRRSWEPDSPCRAVRPTLRQITLLDQSVEAAATSRLAGAGMFIVPSEAEIIPLPSARAQQPGAEPLPPPEAGDDAGDDDDFVQIMVDVASMAIKDRGTAAAIVPLVVRLPGDLCDKPRHITFWSEFSDSVPALRTSAVQRLALGMDMPPEVLTGMAGMNHWGAWQVEETAVTLHIEPMAEIICHALTIGYLRPALRAAGYADEADQFLVWYDTTDLTTRPDRSEDATAAYDRIELSGAAYRREIGMSEEDKPTDAEARIRILLKVAEGAPTLAPAMLAEAGIIDPDVAAAADAARADEQAGDGGSPPPPPGDDGPPDTRDDEPAAVAASGALLEACDGMVWRALERAGARLKSAAGRSVTGGPASVDGDVATLHTRLDATTYAQLDYLLQDSWSRVPAIAERHRVDADALQTALDAYTRALIATGHTHDIDRLSDAIGLR